MAHFIADACVGCGACKRVCPVECITGESKLLHLIDPKVCIDCGACGIVCPVSCISDPGGKVYPFLKPKERPKAVVEDANCSGCQYCIDICPFSCLELHGTPGDSFAVAVSYNAHPNKCVACKLCVNICPRETIDIVFPGQEGEKQSA